MHFVKHPPRHPSAPSLLCALLLLLLLPFPVAPALHAQPQAPTLEDKEIGNLELIDRVLALVDEDPILLSDLQLVVGLGLAEAEAGESDDAFRRRVLERLIEQRLRFHEVDRFGAGRLAVEQIDRGLDNIRRQFDTEAEFQERMRELGLTEDEVRQVVARQIAVIQFVNERLGPRVFVDLEEIQAYYDRVLVPAAAAAGEDVPPLADVREDIRGLLQEGSLNDEIETWTEELRAEADVQILLDDYPPTLPPVVERFDLAEPAEAAEAEEPAAAGSSSPSSSPTPGDDGV